MPKIIFLQKLFFPGLRNGSQALEYDVPHGGPPDQISGLPGALLPGDHLTTRANLPPPAEKLQSLHPFK